MDIDRAVEWCFATFAGRGSKSISVREVRYNKRPYPPKLPELLLTKKNATSIATEASVLATEDAVSTQNKNKWAGLAGAKFRSIGSFNFNSYPSVGGFKNKKRGHREGGATNRGECLHHVGKYRTPVLPLSIKPTSLSCSSVETSKQRRVGSLSPLLNSSIVLLRFVETYNRQ